MVGLGEGPQNFIVLQLRAPRVIVGLLVGLAVEELARLYRLVHRLAADDADVGAAVKYVAAASPQRGRGPSRWTPGRAVRRAL